MPNQALEQTRDSVLRYGEVVGCELLNAVVRQQEAQSRVGLSELVMADLWPVVSCRLSQNVAREVSGVLRPRLVGSRPASILVESAFKAACGRIVMARSKGPRACVTRYRIGGYSGLNALHLPHGQSGSAIALHTSL